MSSSSGVRSSIASGAATPVRASARTASTPAREPALEVGRCAEPVVHGARVGEQARHLGIDHVDRERRVEAERIARGFGP